MFCFVLKRHLTGRQMKGRKRRVMVTPEKKWHSRKHQREKLSKVISKLGKMVLKEEMEKSLPIQREPVPTGLDTLSYFLTPWKV